MIFDDEGKIGRMKYYCIILKHSFVTKVGSEDGSDAGSGSDSCE